MKKPLYTAGISGIIVLVLSIISGIFGQFIYKFSAEVILIYSSVIWIILTFFCILYAIGFLFLARKYKAKLLLVMTWIGIIFNILIFVFFMVSNIISVIPGVLAQVDGFGNENVYENMLFNGESGEITEEGMLMIIGLIIFWVIFSVIYGTYSILFGIGLLKLKDKIELSRVSGILNIVSGATMIIFVGVFVSIAAMIVEIVMFFKASRKLECGKIVLKK